MMRYKPLRLSPETVFYGSKTILVRYHGMANELQETPASLQAFNQASKTIYLKYYGLLEKRRWSMDEDIAWDQITSQPEDQDLLEMLYTASLIETYTFTTTPNFLRRYRHLPWIIALQMARGYEECKHGNALWRYLEGQGFPVNEQEISEIQEVDDSFESMDLFARNVLSWLSEIETTVFYRKASEQISDPVGKHLLALISQDERVHGSFLYETILAQIQADGPQRLAQLQQLLADYQNPEQESHYGAAVGAENFGRIRAWANTVGANQEISDFVSQRVRQLMQAVQS